MQPLDLPPPDPEALAVSAALVERMRAEIDATGPLPFQRYMELALYAPGLGYYSAGARKFGAEGDFVTAPELGPVYAELLAQSLAPLLRNLDQPTILELGGGSGALAADLWRALSARDARPIRYAILERSADLRERQIGHLSLRVPEAMPRVVWLDSPPTERFDGVVIANEVVDALACARFVLRADGLREQAVTISGDGLGMTEIPARQQVASAVDALRDTLPWALPEGYLSELLPELAPWLASIAGCLREGIMLFADYGYPRHEYYLPERKGGTLRCHYRHRVHDDPLWLPGLNDLTASVDFTALAEAGHGAGLDLLCYQSQAGFLAQAGIEEVYADLAQRPARERMRISAQLQKLMLPGEMGERFQIMAFSRHLDPERLPPVWSAPGLRHRL